MNFLSALVVWCRVKVWFATIGVYRLLVAKYRLYKYEQSLPPERRTYAIQLRKDLAAAKSSDAKAGVLVRHARKLQEDQARVTERIDRIARGGV